MQLREYKTSDAKALYELFYQTVHSVNAHDYTEDQLNVWATGTVDIHKWNESFVKHKTVVATEGTTIVGFGDIDDTGYLDRLFVHKDYQRQGIASAICDRLESSVSATLISTQASITARPFFEKLT